VRRGTELIGGAHMSVRGEGEGIDSGRCKPKKKTHCLEDANGTQAGSTGP
jgi:hypothetical protein